MQHHICPYRTRLERHRSKYVTIADTIECGRYWCLFGTAHRDSTQKPTTVETSTPICIRNIFRAKRILYNCTQVWGTLSWNHSRITLAAEKKQKKPPIHSWENHHVDRSRAIRQARPTIAPSSPWIPTAGSRCGSVSGAPCLAPLCRRCSGPDPLTRSRSPLDLGKSLRNYSIPFVATACQKDGGMRRVGEGENTGKVSQAGHHETLW